jgi:rhodanese-related sulfurtransferase
MTIRDSRLGALKRRAIALAVLMLVLAGCASTGTAKSSPSSGPITKPPAGQPAASLAGLAKNGDGYVDLTIQQLADALPAKGFTLVNVHVPYAGELPQTDLFIPYDEIVQQTNKLPDKSAPIVLYCRSGHMSTEAAKSLVKLGYTNIMELDGGMSAWESAGHEVLLKQ